MDQPVDNGDHTGRIGEHLIPLRKGAISGDDRRPDFIPSADDLEEQVGVAIAIGVLAADSLR